MWLPDVDATNHFLFHKGMEYVGAAYYTFERLLSSNKLPQTMWDAVEAEVPSPEEEEEKEEEDEEEEEKDDGAQPVNQR